jgi:uncharacterized protein (TIGR00369 family)
MSSHLSLGQVQQLLDGSPMIAFLKVRVSAIDVENNTAKFEMPIRPELERQPGTGQYHGGAIASFIDIAGDFALAALLGGIVPTVNLRVDYLRPAGGAQLTATAAVRRAGRTIGVVDIDVYDMEDRLVAVGRGAYGTASS